MEYDFDAIIPRRGTDCEKWDLLAEDDVLPLWVADMDFRAAPAIVDALRRRVDEGVFGYALPPSSWHESLIRWLTRRHGWKIRPNSILDATGVIPALAVTIRAFCKPGDKVVIQTPVYNCFYSVIHDQGCGIVENRLLRIPVPGGVDGDFTYEINFEELEHKVVDAKLLVLSNPHNPAGRAWRADELRRVGEICFRHGVFVASDEIHADLQMPGSRHVPFASLGGDFSQWSATFWSASKAFNLAGLQTAAVVCANDAARERIRHVLRVNRTGELNPFGFVASKVAWDECEGWLDALRNHIHGNYSALMAFIRDRLPELQIARLEATYLAWVDATPLGVPSAELARRLEHEAKVKFSPGAIYGEEKGAAYLRINLACPRTTLLEALGRTAWFYQGIEKEVRLTMTEEQNRTTHLTRDAAWELLTRYNKDAFHLHHAETVEKTMRWFARELGYVEEEGYWGIVGLLHDIDFEQWPQEHCLKSQTLLKELGVEDSINRAVASHGYGIVNDIAPEHLMEKVLFAVDELTGLLGAVVLMYPSKSVKDLNLKSVKKKFKDKKFAAGCSRDVIRRGAEQLGWTLDELIARTIVAVQSFLP